MYYTGVTGMVGFWLLIGDVETPLQAWFVFAGSYLALVICEPVVTYFAVKGLKSIEDRSLIARLTVVRDLKIA